MHPKIPKYRCYKPKNLGLVDIDGKQHYLGRYGSPESVAAYNRLIQEWLAQGGASPALTTPAEGAPSINELIWPSGPGAPSSITAVPTAPPPASWTTTATRSGPSVVSTAPHSSCTSAPWP